MEGKMRMTPEGFQNLKKYEGCHLTAYRDPSGIYTIGYGQTAGVKYGMQITQEEADAWLDMYVVRLEQALSNVIEVELKPHQWDAIVSFVYNIGLGNFKKSHLLAKINKNPDDPTIFMEFGRWTKARGQKLDKLIRRRAWEASRWAGNE